MQQPCAWLLSRELSGRCFQTTTTMDDAKLHQGIMIGRRHHLILRAATFTTLQFSPVLSAVTKISGSDKWCDSLTTIVSLGFTSVVGKTLVAPPVGGSVIRLQLFSLDLFTKGEGQSRRKL